MTRKQGKSGSRGVSAERSTEQLKSLLPSSGHLFPGGGFIFGIIRFPGGAGFSFSGSGLILSSSASCVFSFSCFFTVISNLLELTVLRPSVCARARQCARVREAHDGRGMMSDSMVMRLGPPPYSCCLQGPHVSLKHLHSLLDIQTIRR